jgi:hypothetical protein
MGSGESPGSSNWKEAPTNPALPAAQDVPPFFNGNMPSEIPCF